MNARQARELEGVLGVVCPGATDIHVSPESDGAQVVITGIVAAGNTEPGSTALRMSVRDGGSPVLRMLLSGRA